MPWTFKRPGVNPDKMGIFKFFSETWNWGAALSLLSVVAEVKGYISDWMWLCFLTGNVDLTPSENCMNLFLSLICNTTDLASSLNLSYLWQVSFVRFFTALVLRFRLRSNPCLSISNAFSIYGKWEIYNNTLDTTILKLIEFQDHPVFLQH